MHQNPSQRGRRQLKAAGYARGGDIKQDKATAASAVHAHEAHLHKGEPKTKLRAGGRVHGKEAMERPDRRARGGHITTDTQPDDDMGNNVKDSGRARGGSVGKKGASKVVININAGSGDPQQAQHEQMAHQEGIQQGAQLGAKMAAAKMGGGGPPGAPPPGAGMGGPPPGAMPPTGMGPGGPPPGAMPPHPMMAPPGMPPRARGGAMRDPVTGRFSGGAV